MSVAEQSYAGSPDLVNGLREDQFTDLYDWLEIHFPHEQDPNEIGADFVSPREMIWHWRDGLLRSLAAKGTYDACRAIQKIMLNHPKLNLEWLMQDARTAARRSTWHAPQPAEILELTRRPSSRLVRNGEELLEVLGESFTRLQKELQGETPAAPNLWNKIAKGKYRPKDEHSFSNYAKRFLDCAIRRQGIIVNREVEIRRGEGGARGEQTDNI